jgi:ribulose-5-phosphate 4-epimerase/fuculose-1-phosphate aldolase
MNAPLKSVPRIECSPEEWEARVDLACAYRIVSAMGWHHSLIYNHISMRVPGTQSHFLINPFGLLYNEITASNLLKVDLDGNKLVPSQYPVLMAGFVVHRSIHMAREDAHAVIHTHSKAGVAVACQEQGLLPINLGAMHLFDKIAYYDVEGVTNDAEESAHIAQALGNKNVMILQSRPLDLRPDHGARVPPDAPARDVVRDAGDGAVGRRETDLPADGRRAQDQRADHAARAKKGHQHFRRPGDPVGGGAALDGADRPRLHALSA